MQFYLKIYETDGQRSIAVCDIEIRGIKIKHNGVTIPIRESYYGNNIYDADEVLYEIRRSTSINAFGKNVCNLLVNEEMIHPDTIIWFDHENDKIGHVIILR